MSGYVVNYTETAMEMYVLVVLLTRNSRPERIPVNDCSAGVTWIREAWRWAERSGIDQAQPMYACYPADSPVVVRVKE